MRKVILTLVLVSIISFVSAQELYLDRDIKPNMSIDKAKVYTLDIFNGLSFPQGGLNDFLKDGFNSGLLIHKRFGKKLSIGLSANHSRYSHKSSFGLFQNTERHELSATSFDIGPQYNLNLGRFALEFYGRSGLSIVNSPQTSMLYPETDITITSLEAYKSTALTTRLGASMTANISKGLNLYLSSEYITSLNRDMSYITRDLTEAFRQDGSIDTDAANELPYKSEKLSLSMLNVNLGVRISIGGNSSRRKSNDLKKEIHLSETYSSYNVQAYLDIPNESQAGSIPQGENASSGDNSFTVNNNFISDKSNSQAHSHHTSRSHTTSVIAPDTDEREMLLDSNESDIDKDSFVEIPKEKLRFKSKAQLAKERRKKKRAVRQAKRLMLRNR